MLDIKYIREHSEEVKKNCENRLSSANIEELLKLDEQRRKIIGEIDALRVANETKVQKASQRPKK